MRIGLDLSPLEMLPGIEIRLQGVLPLADAELFDAELFDASVSGDPELPGFLLDLSQIFLRRVP